MKKIRFRVKQNIEYDFTLDIGKDISEADAKELVELINFYGKEGIGYSDIGKVEQYPAPNLISSYDTYSAELTIIEGEEKSCG